MVQVHAPHPWQTSFTEQAPPKKNKCECVLHAIQHGPKANKWSRFYFLYSHRNDLVLPTTTSVGQSSKPRVQPEVSSKRFRTRVAKPPCHP
eukprot:scaffold25100_cov145-Amphora_coffeaeformis.AAC.2